VRRREAQPARDQAQGLALRVAECPVGQGDAHRLGQEPLPGLGRQLCTGRGDRVLQVAGQVLKVGLERVVVEVGRAVPADRIDRTAPRSGVGGVARAEDDHRGGTHRHGEDGLHLLDRRRAQGTEVEPVTAGRALDDLPHAGQGDHRQEEEREPSAGHPVPIVPVTSTVWAVKVTFAHGSEEHGEPEDQQHGRPPPVAT
jgi:hypothetical protein